MADTSLPKNAGLLFKSRDALRGYLKKALIDELGADNATVLDDVDDDNLLDFVLNKPVKGDDGTDYGPLMSVADLGELADAIDVGNDGDYEAKRDGDITLVADDGNDDPSDEQAAIEIASGDDDNDAGDDIDSTGNLPKDDDEDKRTLSDERLKNIIGAVSF